MGKIINLSAVLEKEEKLQQVVDYVDYVCEKVPKVLWNM